MRNIFSFLKAGQSQEPRTRHYLTLGKFDFFKGLTRYELRTFSKMLIRRKYKKDEAIFKEGYPHAVLYLVESGMVDIVISDGTGNDILLDSLKAYSHFGEIVLFLDSVEAKRTATAIAREDSVLWAISKRDFVEFYTLNPKTGVKILFNLSEHFSKVIIANNKKIKEMECRPARSKN